MLLVTLGCTELVGRVGLSSSGLDMTLVAIGACMIIAAAAQTAWRAPRGLSPFVKLGQRSYEIYLTHMFIVFALFGIFVRSGKPLEGVPLLFLSITLVSGFFGEAVARFYSEPMNRLLRRRWGDGPETLGSVVAPPGSST